ncbi:hypothetical protein PAU_01323 [Photorhabdus asymbiotica]|uniref:Uncharacterized protein n=1 Tax=Photorhabdus asymbiotica subsp. asymbiotica (strain ATCC 43949 / 3105-77) TaxID=553480 RepID=C7BRL4_PHOAA|nr:hypothetical protein PAU_01323 [Photorhabdus asymbiotica]
METRYIIMVKFPVIEHFAEQKLTAQPILILFA